MDRASALSDLICLFCTSEPPWRLIETGYVPRDDKANELQEFIVNNLRVPWLTGIGVLEVLDELVQQAVDNDLDAFAKARPVLARGSCEFDIVTGYNANDGTIPHAPATVALGSGKEPAWQLCERCAKDPRFSRFKCRRELLPYRAK